MFRKEKDYPHSGERTNHSQTALTGSQTQRDSPANRRQKPSRIPSIRTQLENFLTPTPAGSDWPSSPAILAADWPLASPPDLPLSEVEHALEESEDGVENENPRKGAEVARIERMRTVRRRPQRRRRRLR